MSWPKQFNRVGPKRNERNRSERQCQSQQRREIVDEFIHTCRRRIFLEKKFHAVGQRLQQSVRPDAMRPPTRLHVRDDFAFEPRQIGIHRQHDEQQQRNLDERDDQFRVGGEEGVHGSVFASGRDSIMVQKRPSVPLVNKVSFAERIRPTGTSYGAWPFRANCTRVASAPPVSNPAGCTL